MTLVDLDPEMTRVSNAVPALGELNKHAFDDPRVTVTNADAFVWLDRHETEPFDIAIVDFPDPNNFALGKLYTTRFYNLAEKQSSNPIRQSSSKPHRRSSPGNRSGASSKRSRPSGFTVKPYQTTVPSFGVWGFALAKTAAFDTPTKPPANVELQFLNDETFASMFEFPTDTSRPADEIEINRLDNQALVRYYEAEWRRFEQ